ncbi:unnamed protein product [Gadus morhua 'NCC']
MPAMAVERTTFDPSPPDSETPGGQMGNLRTQRQEPLLPPPRSAPGVPGSSGATSLDLMSSTTAAFGNPESR